MDLAKINVKEFYNGRSLLALLEDEKIISYYVYDRDKKGMEDKYREITYFLTETHLIRTTVMHHDIIIEKWRRDDFSKIEKKCKVKIFNREYFTEIEEILVKTSDETIRILPPIEETAGDEKSNFIEFMRRF